MNDEGQAPTLEAYFESHHSLPTGRQACFLFDIRLFVFPSLYIHAMNDEDFMRQALRQAQTAFDKDEVPVGAVIVMNDKIISRGYNQVEQLADPTAHAEIIALTSAFNYLGSKYLPDATIYVTVEPCLMCAGALYWSKIGRVVYGASDPKNGYLHVTKDISPFHPKTVLSHGILQDECVALMKSFFQQKR